MPAYAELEEKAAAAASRPLLVGRHRPRTMRLYREVGA